MACHHDVEGPCLVCERVAIRKREPKLPPRLLHLAQPGGLPLCGSHVDPEDRFSSLQAHDTERFCRLCLIAHRGRERAARAASAKAWRNRPRSEKVKAFNQMAFGPVDLYSFLPLMVFRALFLMGLFFLAGGAGAIWGWSTGLTVGILYTFLVRHIAISRS